MHRLGHIARGRVKERFEPDASWAGLHVDRTDQVALLEQDPAARLARSRFDLLNEGRHHGRIEAAHGEQVSRTLWAQHTSGGRAHSARLIERPYGLARINRETLLAQVAKDRAALFSLR